MGLSRLDNFLKSVRGQIIYVDPNSLDSTDSVENQGNSLTRPFKTIQRALIESSRFSYQKGLNNDRFGQTTILLYPGDHIVDNRPGWIPDGFANFRLRNGLSSSDIPEFSLRSSFDLSDPNNILYKLNSIHGGVIVPRGTSIVGLDLRKTKIRPLYVPNPTNDNIERSTIFRVTGACYFWQFSFFDADPNAKCYVDYTSNQFVPNFSHHKLTCFEYADGVNPVNINDQFVSYTTNRTDLDMYYEKVGLVYGQSSGRAISPDYPSDVDIQSKVDEYRIVGSTGDLVGITSIRSGDGIISRTTITVTTEKEVLGLDVDTPFRVQGVSANGYNGQFVVSEKLSDTEVQYQVQNAPINPLPNTSGAILSLSSDTVTSASPYIFNISLRSVYGMCGLLADGNKASGFKSMVVAQFTGIGLQKDDNAFVLYGSSTGTYQDNTTPGNETISTNSRSLFKPEYRNFHIKAINDAFIQNVSIFAIGFSEHFSVESGGDMSITNSNSNFGAKSLVASGFRRNSFPQDDLGYITHIIPPKEISRKEKTIEYKSIDVDTTIGFGSTSRLYFYGQTNRDVFPESSIEGYRIGARKNDTLNVIISGQEMSARIIMPGSNSSSEKVFSVGRSPVGINSISSNTITLTKPHNLLNGETIRILSNTAQLPDGITPNAVYYAITNTNPNSGITTTTRIKISATLNDSISARALDINNNGGELSIVSRVSDKKSGEFGHPIQYDSSIGQWYINVSSASTENSIYSTIVSLGSSVLGESTTRTYINRKQDDRNKNDTIYRLRYVIPKTSQNVFARPPSDGFIIQESNSSTGTTNAEIQTYFGNGTLTSENQLRNPRFISNVEWLGGFADITTELPHNISIGSEVEIINVTSTNNPSGENNFGYNGTHSVISTNNRRHFRVEIKNNPGIYTNDTSARNTFLPYFKRKKYNTTLYIHQIEESQKYIQKEQDGVYYLTVLNASNSPSARPFENEKFTQPIKELYPQKDRDNPVSDPNESVCFASNSLIGDVVVDDVRNSITKETLIKNIQESNISSQIVDIVSIDPNRHRVFTSLDHGFNRIISLTVANPGFGYGLGNSEEVYNVPLVGVAGLTGQHATAKVKFNALGSITDIKIMHGGSAYEVGDPLTISGIATNIIGGFTDAVLFVNKIYNNTNDVVKISGISSDSYRDFNDLYRIEEIEPGSTNSLVIQSSNPISSGSTIGIGFTATLGSSLYNTGASVVVTSLNYDNVSGIATVTTSQNHGFNVDQKIRLVGANEQLYNGDFVVTRNINLNTFSINIGVGTVSPTATGTIYIFREGITSNQGLISIENENLNGRMISVYAGITTTLSTIIPNETVDQINILNVQNLDINVGDYLMIDDEIVRVKTAVPSTALNPIYVFRGVLGTIPTSHQIGSVVKRIKISPVELRRHSIIRASGHTFEYVGFGPGNYSTAFPDKQDRQISSKEEILAQSTRKEGGINFYTGMNDKGISYSGNKRLSAVTGKEEIFDTPVQTITGEDIGNLQSINITNSTEVIVDRSIRIEGGIDNSILSEFDGPVLFTNKVTVSNDLESNALFLQGDARISRKYTVGISTPVISGNPGDIIYLNNPKKGGFVGWIYTLDNEWYRFGNISISKNSNIGLFDNIGISTEDPHSFKFLVNSGLDQVSIDEDGGLGIGTTANQFKLNVLGDTNLDGNLYVNGSFFGDGSGLTNLNAAALGWTQIPGGIYNTVLGTVGVGTSSPRFNLEVGAVGAGGTSLWVNNEARIDGLLRTNNIIVSGNLTANSYNFTSNTGTIQAGIVTATTLIVGTGGTAITTLGSNVGIGTSVPRAKLDVEGHTLLKTLSTNVQNLEILFNSVNIDLSSGQTFELLLDSNVDYFVITNPPNGSSNFTIKITQNFAGNGVASLDDFRTSSGSSVPIYWPGGGVLPIVTPVAGSSDIYSYRTFDSGVTWYAVVVGQNFKN
jgi:hypothetical protein